MAAVTSYRLLGLLAVGIILTTSPNKIILLIGTVASTSAAKFDWQVPLEVIHSANRYGRSVNIWKHWQHSFCFRLREANRPINPHERHLQIIDPNMEGDDVPSLVD